MGFVHLHLHSEYSMTDSLVRIGDESVDEVFSGRQPLPDLVGAAAQDQHTALALTDLDNVFGVVKFYLRCLEFGIKPIIGCELSIENELSTRQAAQIVVLCMNNQGYHNLLKLLSLGYQDVERRRFLLKREWLKSHGEGLIALSGGHTGDVGQAMLANNADLARQMLAFWKQCFPGRYYMEITRTQKRQENKYNALALELALDEKLPVVASNNVRFVRENQFHAYEVRVCIAEKTQLGDKQRSKQTTPEQYLKTAAQLEALFADIPSALENTVEIAKRCTVHIETGKILLPAFPMPEQKTAEDELKSQSEANLESILSKIPPAAQPQYLTRLQKEISIINKMGYAGYFLIVSDIVRWAKQRGIAVGPGRGSGAGSLVAYALGITTIDPIQYRLLFERFLNPERVSMPDLDIDVCVEKRNEVIEYIAERYGRDKVSQIITFGSMAAKAAVRDVGRVLGYGYGYVDTIAKLIPNDLNITLEQALQNSAELKQRYETDNEVKVLIDTSRALEGLARNPGTHAGGIVIAPQPLTHYTAIYSDVKEQNQLTQFDMKDLEKIGLIKFDFLGLRTLTIIDKTVRAINQDTTAENIQIEEVPLDDAATYTLLKEADTTAVFQLESEGIRTLLRNFQPDHFEDIIALIALYRPGPLESGMVDDYIKRRRGAKITYPHPLLEEILKPTYGVIVYQEQVMQIAQALAGYSLGGADLLRRAMGKKLRDEMKEQQKVFVTSATKRGIDQGLAEKIFDVIEKFAGYGFNRSHSVSYAFLAYQTAWLKAHYPATFMSVVLSSEMHNQDKISQGLYECREKNLKILPPDVNESYFEFTHDGQSQVRYGLGAIKQLSGFIAHALCRERQASGKFKHLMDFCVRLLPLGLTHAWLKFLIAAGAVDTLGLYEAETVPDQLEQRKKLLLHHVDVFTLAKERCADQKVGQSQLFKEESVADSMRTNQACKPLSESAEVWEEKDLLNLEHGHLGFYLSKHPFVDYENEVEQCLQRMKRQQGDAANTSANGQKKDAEMFAGVVTQIKEVSSRFGKYAMLTLDTGKKLQELRIADQLYIDSIDLLQLGKILLAQASVYYDTRRATRRWKAQQLYTLDKARSVCAECVCLDLSVDHAEANFVEQLKAVLRAYVSDQGCVIKIVAQGENIDKTDLYLPEHWQVSLCEELLGKLRVISGIRKASVLY